LALSKQNQSPEMKLKAILMAIAICSLAACANPESTTPTTPAGGSDVNPPKTPPEYGTTPSQHADTAVHNARNPNEMPPVK